MKIIEGLLYSDEHEWVKVDGDNALIGITDYAQKRLGDIAYIEMPEEESIFDAGDTFGVIESVKAASDLFIPVSGVVIKINEDVEEDPSVINTDPYGSWIIEISLEDKAELEGLFSSSAYEELTSKE